VEKYIHMIYHAHQRQQPARDVSHIGTDVVMTRPAKVQSLSNAVHRTPEANWGSRRHCWKDIPSANLHQVVYRCSEYYAMEQIVEVALNKLVEYHLVMRW